LHSLDLWEFGNWETVTQFIPLVIQTILRLLSSLFTLPFPHSPSLFLSPSSPPPSHLFHFQPLHATRQKKRPVHLETPSLFGLSHLSILHLPTLNPVGCIIILQSYFPFNSSSLPLLIFSSLLSSTPFSTILLLLLPQLLLLPLSHGRHKPASVRLDKLQHPCHGSHPPLQLRPSLSFAPSHTQAFVSELHPIDAAARTPCFSTVVVARCSFPL